MRTTVPGVRTIVLICAFVATSFSSFSQSIVSGNGKYEVGLAFGPLFFLGDLGGTKGIGRDFVKDVNFPLTKVSKGLFASAYLTEWLGFRAAINHGVLEGNDALIKDNGGAEIYRKRRNQEFRSSIIEAYLAIEFSPTVFFEKYDGLQGKLRPYGVAGVGMFKFNPKARYYAPDGTATWVALHPLRTEGQGLVPGKNEYKLTSLEIPMGVGLKYYFKENKYVGLEVLHRKTFTDYVDDVSTNYVDNAIFQNLAPELRPMANQLFDRIGFDPKNSSMTRPTRATVGEQRGDPKDNDSYFSTLIRFGWRLNDKNSPGGRATRQMRCPSFY